MTFTACRRCTFEATNSRGFRRPARGVAVRSGRLRLRETAAPLASEAAEPDVAWFARANPGHAEGDMLICLCPLTLRNWLSVMRKMLARRRRLRAH